MCHKKLEEKYIRMTQPDSCSRGRSVPAHYKILLGLLIGATGGTLCQLLFGEHSYLLAFTTYVSEPFGRLFLRLIFMIVVPLLFCALTLGVAGIGDARTLGRIGIKSFLYTIIVTSLAVAVGLLVVNYFRPGDGMPPEIRTALQGASSLLSPPSSSLENPVLRTLAAIVPDNPLRAAVQGEMLAVMFFSLMIGISIGLSPQEKVAPLVRVLEGFYEVIMRLIAMIMRLAPYAVAALLFTITARFGLSVLRPLLAYMGVVLLSLCIHQFVTYSLLLRFLVGMRPGFFFSQISEVMMTAFSTCSSNATLPTTLRVTQEKFHVPRDIAAFVLTLGSTANQNGTALFEGVTILFLAQVYGIHLSFSSQVLVVLGAVLAGIGTAGVPGSALPMIASILVSVGIPAEGIGIILGVDRLLDMSRTVLNVTGDIVAAVYITHSEGRLRILPSPPVVGKPTKGIDTKDVPKTKAMLDTLSH